MRPGVDATAPPAQSPNRRLDRRGRTASASRSPADDRASHEPGRCARSWTARSSAAVSPSTVSAVPPAGRWYGDVGRVDRRRRTPPRRDGAGRPSPGGGRSAARRGGARPRPLGERRPAHDLGQQLERGREPGSPARRARRDVASQPASACSEAPSRSDGLDQRDRVVVLGALGQGAGREDGRARLAGGLVDSAVPAAPGRGHERPAGQVRDEHPQAVVEVGARPRSGTRTVAGSRGWAARRRPGRRGGSRWRSCRGLLGLVAGPPRRRPRDLRGGRSARRGCRGGTRPRPPAGSPPASTARYRGSIWLMRSGSSKRVAYIDSRSATSSTRPSAPSSSASMSAWARASSSSVTGSTVSRSSSSWKAASTRSMSTPGRAVTQPAKIDAPPTKRS